MLCRTTTANMIHVNSILSSGSYIYSVTQLELNHLFTRFVGCWLYAPLTSVRQQQISSPFKETECTKGPLLPHKEKMKFSVDLPSTQCSCSFAGLRTNN